MALLESGLVNLLGDLASVYPHYVPPGTALPAISYLRLSTVTEQTHDGPDNLLHIHVQFTCHAAHHAEALTMADVIRRRLNGFRGLIGSVRIANAELNNLIDSGYQDATESWTAIVDLIFHTEET